MSERDEAKGAFDLGRVIQRTFTTIGRNWAIFFGAAVLFVGLPGAVTTWVQAESVTLVKTGPVVGWLGELAAGLVIAIGSFVLQGVVMKAAVNSFGGKRTPFNEAFNAGLGRVLPLVGMAIAASIGIVFGLILLIIPGVMLWVVWSVAAPAVVVEKRGALDSLERSVALTAGHRWAIFGLLIVYLIASSMFQRLLGGIGTAIDGSSGDNGVWGALIGGILASVVSSVVAAAGTASLYYELRTAKEGVSADDLASVFD